MSAEAAQPGGSRRSGRPRLLVLRPSFGERAGGRRYGGPARLEPLALGILKALTPPHWDVRCVDERLDAVPSGEPFDLAALSVCSFSARRAYEVADALRARGVPVVLGGIHPTLLPDEAAQHADAVACGDAEGLWPQIVADFEAGRLQPRYRSATPGPAVPRAPDRSAWRAARYLPLRLLQFGRGCQHSCEFCAVRSFYGGHTARRSVAAVLEELDRSPARHVFFVDDNLLAERTAFVALLEALLPRKVRWSSQMDLSIADDPELLRLARASGCQSLTIGFESLSPQNLRQMRKGWSRVDEYRERLARLRRAGLLVYGTFVFGYDGDRVDSFARTLQFALQERLFLANFNPLQPLPGTPLYERLLRERRLRRERWWLDPGYRWHEALIEPRGMTPAQLTEGCRWARERFHGLSGVLRRLPNPAHWRRADNLAVFLAANAVSRLDIRAKSGLRLGGA